MWISVKVFPGVRIGGRIGGRKRRRGGYRPPRKPWPTPVKVGIGAAVAGLFVAGVLTGQDGSQTPGAVAATAPTTSAPRVVHRADITPWPLLVDSVTLACIDHHDTTATVNGVVYALNSSATVAHRGTNLTPELAGPITLSWVADGLGKLVDAGDRLC